MRASSQLPDGWAWEKVRELVEPDAPVVYGILQPGPEADDGIPYVRPTEIQRDQIQLVSLRKTTPEIAKRYERSSLKSEDVILSIVGTIGKVALVPTELAGGNITQSSARVRVDAAVMLPRFMAWALRSPVLRDQFGADKLGTAVPRLNLAHVRDFWVPVAPRNEQHRIVAKIEELFSDLEAGAAALERARANLKRYRAAVLAAAVEGKLTEQWRAENPDVEPASALLERTLAERRRKWEEEQLAKYEAKGKKPPKEWRDRYKDPLAPDVANLPKLPAGWCWATAEQCAAWDEYAITDGPFGSNLKTAHYTSSGPRVIRLQNVGDGIFIDEYAHISLDRYERLSKHHVCAGDLVIAMLGESLPRACVVPDWVPPAIVKADCVRYKPHATLASARYLNIALNASPTKSRASSLVQGIGRPRLNLSKVRTLALPLPPIEEQHHITSLVEERLSLAEDLCSQIDKDCVRAGRLRQSILKRAFEGELVQQDPNDEPATVLLDRIKAWRKQTGAVTKGHSKAKNEQPKLL